MKKNGFTIVELMGTVVILGVILAITMPLVGKLINNAEDGSYDLLVSNIKGAAQNYIADNMNIIPENDGDKVIITLNDLVEGNYMDTGVENPKTHKQLSYLNTTITITYTNGSYVYEVNLVDEN